MDREYRKEHEIIYAELHQLFYRYDVIFVNTETYAKFFKEIASILGI